MLIWFCGALFGIGCVLALIGLWGKRIAGTFCKRCRYDIGSLKSDRCPECGSETDSSVQSYRVRRKFVLITGLLILVCGAAGITTPGVRNQPVLRYIPTRVLIAGMDWFPENWIHPTHKFYSERWYDHALVNRTLTPEHYTAIASKTDSILADAVSLGDLDRWLGFRRQHISRSKPISDDARIGVLRVITESLQDTSDDELRLRQDEYLGLSVLVVTSSTEFIPVPHEATGVVSEFITEVERAQTGSQPALTSNTTAALYSVLGPWLPEAFEQLDRLSLIDDFSSNGYYSAAQIMLAEAAHDPRAERLVRRNLMHSNNVVAGRQISALYSVGHHTDMFWDELTANILSEDEARINLATSVLAKNSERIDEVLTVVEEAVRKNPESASFLAAGLSRLPAEKLVKELPVLLMLADQCPDIPRPRLIYALGRAWYEIQKTDKELALQIHSRLIEFVDSPHQEDHRVLYSELDRIDKVLYNENLEAEQLAD